MENAEKIILGIDPGTRIMGYGIIGIFNKKPKLLTFGVIHLTKYTGYEMKLKKIFERVTQLIEDYLPDEMAIEAPFYGVNVQAMLKLGRAQGVAMAAALMREVPIVEYAPKKIKMSVTGNGNASKEQVAAMLKRLLGFEEVPEMLDATDALGVALCHFFHGNVTQQRGDNKSWSSFIKENPDRVK
jgi:crossover junction endodeoxyribonuclease RuvC